MIWRILRKGMILGVLRHMLADQAWESKNLVYNKKVDTMINNARRYIYITQTVRRRLAMHAFCKDVTALP